MEMLSLILMVLGIAIFVVFLVMVYTIKENSISNNDAASRQLLEANTFFLISIGCMVMAIGIKVLWT
jgi:hypothetical protein